MSAFPVSPQELTALQAELHARTSAVLRDVQADEEELSRAKPRDPRHVDGIEGGEKACFIYFIDKNSV